MHIVFLLYDLLLLTSLCLVVQCFQHPFYQPYTTIYEPSHVPLTLRANTWKDNHRNESEERNEFGHVSLLQTYLQVAACTGTFTSDKPQRKMAQSSINIAFGHSSLMGNCTIREPATSRRYPWQTSHLVLWLLITIQVGLKSGQVIKFGELTATTDTKKDIRLSGGE